MISLKLRFMMIVSNYIYLWASCKNESDLSNRAWELYCDLEKEAKKMGPSGFDRDN